MIFAAFGIIVGLYEFCKIEKLEDKPWCDYMFILFKNSGKCVLYGTAIDSLLSEIYPYNYTQYKNDKPLSTNISSNYRSSSSELSHPQFRILTHDDFP